MSLKVLHFALTPLAGSPMRIVNALNAHTGVRARLVVLRPDAYGRRVFETDWTWDADREEAMAFLQHCDIVHLHHFMDLKSNPFGVDFTLLMRQGKRIIRQYQTMPATVAAICGVDVATILNDPLPQLVLAQFHERFYPRARVVPQIVPIHDEAYTPCDMPRGDVTIFFAPTNTFSRWSHQPGQSRWDTKGYPETVALLERIARDTPGVDLRVRTDLPHEECLRQRQRSQIAIDEIVTGSYHLSSLESLAQGVPTLAWLDRRVMQTLSELTGTTELPWVNLRLEEAEEPLRHLIADPDLREGIGRRSREWMEAHWSDREMIRHFERAYQDLLEDPGRFDRPRFDLSDRTTRWFVQDLGELAFQSLKKQHVSAQGATPASADGDPARRRVELADAHRTLQAEREAFCSRYRQLQAEAEALRAERDRYKAGLEAVLRQLPVRAYRWFKRVTRFVLSGFRRWPSDEQ